MKAAQLFGKEDLRIVDIAKPEINSDEVLLKVKASAICGTDVRMLKNGHKKASESNPLTLGHEIAGEIAEVGANISAYKAGDRVAVAPNLGCGVCDLCVSGNTHMCRSSEALGVTIAGAFAEYMVIPAEAVRQGNICKIGSNTSFEDAALAEPFSCVYNAFELYGVNPGDCVVIIGAGPIGLMHAKLAKMAGAGKIIINDLNTERLAECKEIDSMFLTMDGNNFEENLMKETGGRGADVVITACPAPSAQQAALRIAAIFGRINYFGGLPAGKSEVALDTNEIHYKQLTITGMTRQSLRQFRTCLSLIEQNLVKVSDLISTKSALKDLEAAINRSSRGEGLKNMVVF
ncbi:MAG: alcohol dehydrogenase catalytic domain-containing protein [Spirochaetales bacterium]|uniref:Alcohol dehydrogenase catalytic domain-containing protein n=1 Tax=Candidatus Thalassospirochaeta sargassi TaxID=3119039 RepID=A0AAJ1MPS7_9SPIO|nr:alcohol dehydrogenase catalytic domain-containing protein [Spirochaetales bacterium]